MVAVIKANGRTGRRLRVTEKNRLFSRLQTVLDQTKLTGASVFLVYSRLRRRFPGARVTARFRVYCAENCLYANENASRTRYCNV